jgi:hypothetical protein
MRDTCRILLCSALLVVCGTPVSAQMAPMPGPPEREINVTWSAWAADATGVRSLGIGYSRYLTRQLTVEAAVDVGRDEGTFTVATALLRTGAASPFSAVIGVAATPGTPGANDPEGLGLVWGGGLNFRLAKAFGFRVDAQALSFREKAVSGRLLVSAMFALD